MKKTKAVLAILMAGTMMLGLAGCGGNSSSATQGTTAGTETGSAAGDAAGTDAAASASDMNVMLETPVESLDPQQATDGTSFEVIADYTDGLMQMDADGQAVPAIAESYDLSDDSIFVPMQNGATAHRLPQQISYSDGRELLIRMSHQSMHIC